MVITRQLTTLSDLFINQIIVRKLVYYRNCTDWNQLNENFKSAAPEEDYIS